MTRVHVTRIAGHNYESSTTVYTLRSGCETFHADKRCSHILNSARHSPVHGEQTVSVTAHALPKVMQSYLNPIKPCQHCTLDIEKTADVVVEHDGLDEILLQYFEPGDKKVTTTVRTDEDGETTVSESATEVY